MRPPESTSRPVVLRSVRRYGEDPVDIRVENGVVAAVDASLDEGSARSVDCASLVALPAFVDLHTHLRDPGRGDAETIETGTQAAVAGGYAAVFAMANTQPVVDTAAAAVDVHSRAADAAACDVFQVGAITLGLAGEQLTPLEELATSAARVRIFSDDGHCVSDPVLMREALARIGALGGVLAQHAQCPRLSAGGQVNAGAVAAELDLAPWPGVAEEVIVARDLVLLAEAAANARLHVCHVSTAATVELVRLAKQRALPVTAEVTPHHLALLDTVCLSADPRFKVNPPLRAERDQQAVRDGLADGTIDVVATDHAPHSAESKQRRWCDAPPGMLGLETALPIVVETMVKPGRMTWRQVAEAMAERPARIGGVATSYGRPLAVGEPATMCLVDPHAPWTVRVGDLKSIGRNTPFDGMTLSSRVVATLIRGHAAYDPRGMFIPR